VTTPPLKLIPNTAARSTVTPAVDVVATACTPAPKKKHTAAVAQAVSSIANNDNDTENLDLENFSLDV
jgi:hypothetical protein